MVSKKAMIVFLVSIALAFALGCSKKQTVKTAPTVEEVATETQVAEEIPAVEEQPAAEEAVPEPAMPVCEDIFFDFDKYDLREDAKSTLKNNAGELKEHPNITVIIEGHCDERGTEDYNMALGERRAKATRDYLVSLGLPATMFKIISYGETRPFDPGHNETAWAKNRRAHFVMKK